MEEQNKVWQHTVGNKNKTEHVTGKKIKWSTWHRAMGVMDKQIKLNRKFKKICLLTREAWVEIWTVERGHKQIREQKRTEVEKLVWCADGEIWSSQWLCPKYWAGCGRCLLGPHPSPLVLYHPKKTGKHKYKKWHQQSLFKLYCEATYILRCSNKSAGFQWDWRRTLKTSHNGESLNYEIRWHF